LINLFKLSDVEEGATGFPILGKAIFPKKGSFAFWFNLKKNGEEDPRLLHGACPTLFGIKWGMLKKMLLFRSTCFIFTKMFYKFINQQKYGLFFVPFE
jgi:hypothetical protein